MRYYIADMKVSFEDIYFPNTLMRVDGDVGFNSTSFLSVFLNHTEFYYIPQGRWYGVGGLEFVTSPIELSEKEFMTKYNTLKYLRELTT